MLPALFKKNDSLKFLQISEVKQMSFDEEWKPGHGERNTVRNRYNEMEITLAANNATNQKLKLVCRFYDEGIAFRYFSTKNILLIMKNILILFSLITFANYVFAQNEKLNIVVIGAHPDDADGSTGGTAIQYSQLGHNILFVSLTNRDAGHYNKGGGALAKIRRAEAEEAMKRFGVTYKVLDNHDGELMPDLYVRLQVIHMIREWNADIVIGPRPNDYHPDHRNTAILLQDAAYMVMVPNIAPDTPPLKENPVFLYVQDRFHKPYPFEPDIAVDISDVYQQKIYGMAAHESQYFEWLPWIEGKLDEVPKDEKERVKWLTPRRKRPITPTIRKSIIKWYGKEKAAKVTDSESFEICEFGKIPDDKEIKRLFPMLGN